MHCVSSLPPADSCHTAPTSVRRSNRRPRLSTASYEAPNQDRKSTRLNSSHSQISYAVFCLKKKKNVVQVPLGVVAHCIIARDVTTDIEAAPVPASLCVVCALYLLHGLLGRARVCCTRTCV